MAKTNPADKVEQWPIDKLTPYAKNSRTHSNEQVAQIAASIKEFGFTNPVLIDKDGQIIAGHGRVMAARKLKMEEVPCIRLAHLTEIQTMALVIADNKLTLNAGWDNELLALELGELGDLGFDLDLTGFTAAEIDALTPEKIDPGLTDKDAVPEVPVQPVSVLGDVWLLGKHRLMCGDSTKPNQVGKLLAGQFAQLIHADPPYGMGKEQEGVLNDNLYGAKLDAFQMAWWGAFRPFMQANGSAYIWGNAPELWRLWYCGGLAEAEQMMLRNEIVWDKGDCQGMNSESARMFSPATERCLFFMLGEQGFNRNIENYWEGFEGIRLALKADCDKMGWGSDDIARICGVGMYSHWFTKSQWAFIPAEHYAKLQAAARDQDAFKLNHDELKRNHDKLKRNHDELKRDFYSTRAYFDNTHDAMTDVWSFDRVSGADRHGHATPKPVVMMERIMKSSLPSGGLVVEPFGGSGSTLIGAEKTGRICFTMELQPKYCDVIVKRWQDFTGKKATHAETGKTFDEVDNGN